MSRNLRSRGNTIDLSDDTHTVGDATATRAVQMSVEDYAAFQAFQTHRRQALLSFEIQGTARRFTPSLKTKDPISYKGDTPEELNDFLYECERQFDIKGFQKEENREDVTSADLASYKEETMKKFSNKGDLWTHFKTLLREFESSQKLIYAR